MNRNGASIVPLLLGTCLALPVDVWAARVVMRAAADATVTQVRGDSNQGSVAMLLAGVTQSPQRGPSRTYIRFDLSVIPQSSFAEEVVIEAAELRLFVQSAALVTDETRRLLVTVGECVSPWDEMGITWNNQPCAETVVGVDTLVVDGNDLPRVYSWDIRRTVSDAHMGLASEVSFAVDARSFQAGLGARDIVTSSREGDSGRSGTRLSEATELIPGFVRIWSRERGEFGASAVPTLLVDYSTGPTSSARAMETFLSVLSAIGVALGVYQGIRALRRKAE